MTGTGLSLVLTGVLAGIVNTLAGGGPILTLAGLTALGVDPRIASMTSTVALSPGQILAGWRGARHAALGGRRALAFAGLAIAMVGGAGGGLLLLATDPAHFRGLVPWLILFATLVYAWSGRSVPNRRRFQRGAEPGPAQARGLHPIGSGSVLALLAVYGGYFGGGNSFMLLALLTVTGFSDRPGAAVKNILVAAINFGAVLTFLALSAIDWALVAPLGLGGVIGGLAGALLLERIPAAVVRPLVITTGLATAAWFAGS